jgi:peptidylprolyl isomerase/peptidyl-prolyl cis-trans isomerase D
MAILSKIREKSVFLIVVVGLALFAFVLDPSTLQDFFSSSKINEVGEVNGESISRQEYANALDNYKTSTQNRASDMQAARTVWNNLLREKIYGKQLEEAGITIGENDVWQQMVSQQFVQSNPQFQNELGIFDEDKFKLFLRDLQDQEDNAQWLAWDDYKNRLGINLQRDTYNNLVNAGLGASLKEGKYQYEEENTQISADFVFIPFNSIPDSLVRVMKSEVETYVKNNEKSFQVEASRDISYVQFDIKPSQEDKDAIKNTVAGFLEDSKDERGIESVGFKNATDYPLFFDENESDIQFAESWFMKANLPTVITDDVLDSKVGDTFGPFEEGNFFKITKVVEILKRPDSVQSSHILIPYLGSRSANQSTTKTEAEAQKSADSIFKLVRRNKKKFAEIADEINPDGSKGKGGDIGWFTHTQAFSRNFDPNYAEYIFDNKTGSVGVVKSDFGFHVIRIDEQKNKQDVFKLVTFGRQILPSTETENEIFQKAEKFALAVSEKDGNFNDAARDNNYIVKPAIGLKVLEERVPGIPGNNRGVIQWAFDKESSVGDFKRFDIDKGYILALLTGKTKEGVQDASKAINKVRPILVNEKKAKLIIEKMNGASLNDIATSNGVNVRNVNNVSLKSPSLSGVGNDPKVVGAMYYAKENQLYNYIEGVRGVFAFVVTKKEAPTALPNYETSRNLLAQERKNLTVKIFDALKNTADIEDNRAFFHGVNQ